MPNVPLIHGKGHEELEDQYNDKIVACQFCDFVQLSIIKRQYTCGCLQTHILCAACGKIVYIEDVALCSVRAKETMH